MRTPESIEPDSVDSHEAWMLVIKRKEGEHLRIGSDILLTIVEVNGVFVCSDIEVQWYRAH